MNEGAEITVYTYAIVVALRHKTNQPTIAKNILNSNRVFFRMAEQRKLTLLGRSLKTLESYIENKSFGGYFYSPKFLDGISQRRNEIHEKLMKIASRCMLLTTFLAFFDSISGKITIMGVSVVVNNTFASALSVVVAASLLSMVFVMLDHFMLGQYLYKIGEKAGLRSFNLLLMDRTANDLWQEPMTPKYFGLKSGKGHEFTFWINGVFSLSCLLIGVCYPIIVCMINFVGVWNRSEASKIEYFLSSVSLLICMWALYVLGAFMRRYEFDQADFKEDDGSPTEEFLAKLGIRPENSGNDSAQ